jgi:dTDP-4-dehydrorhamnose reductase
MQNGDKPACLLFGANGQVGFELRRSLALDFSVVALDRGQCDLSDAGQIRQSIQACKPVVIVNAAAYTAVDKAESELDLANAINATALGVIAQEARKIQASVVHYSTDYVFNGQASRPYCETDAVDPQNMYGRSKLAGEQLLLEVLGAAYPFWILRTSWVYGLHGNNFLKTMLKLASNREKISVVADQAGAPTSAALIADVTARLLQVRPVPGTYHLSAAGQTTWHEYAQFAIVRAGSTGMALSLNQHQVSPISTIEYPTPAKRPAYSVLSCIKLEKALSIKLPDWRLSVEQTVDCIVENKNV